MAGVVGRRRVDVHLGVGEGWGREEGRTWRGVKKAGRGNAMRMQRLVGAGEEGEGFGRIRRK